MCWTLFAQSRATHQRSGEKEYNNFPNTWGGVNALTKQLDQYQYAHLSQVNDC